MLSTEHLQGRTGTPAWGVWSRGAPAECSKISLTLPPENNTYAHDVAQAPDKQRADLGIPGTLNYGNRPSWAAGASGAAALLTCCALHPFDLIKTRMQGESGISIFYFPP